MNDIMPSLAAAIPSLLGNSSISLSLTGAPAAISISVISVSVLVGYGIHCWKEVEEMKIDTRYNAF